MNIVLLEPDKVLAHTYREALRSEGHKVTTCATAQAAIFAADDQLPDVVITELQLTGHSGIEFLYEFRSYDEWGDVPVLILTNVPPGEFKDSWDMLQRQLNISGYHYKPLTSLRDVLRSVRSLTPA